MAASPRRAVVFASFLATTIAACSALVDLHGLTGGAVAASDEAGVTDASAAIDGPTTSDGAPALLDAAGAADAAIDGPFCVDGGHVFCADFDEVTSPDQGWSTSDVDPPGSISLSTAHFVSGPKSFLSILPRRGDLNVSKYATIGQTIQGWRHIVVEADVYMEQPDWQAGDINSGILAISFYADNQEYDLTVSTGQTYMTFGVTPSDPMNTDALPIGTWQHLRFEFDPAGSASASVGASHYAKTFSALTPNANPRMFVNVGMLGFNDPAPTFTVYYDNVTIDLL